MMFYSHEVYVFGHGLKTAIKLQGSTPHDQLLIGTSDSFLGLLLFAIGSLLFMVGFVQDREFQRFFAKGFVFLLTMFTIGFGSFSIDDYTLTNVTVVFEYFPMVSILSCID